MKRLNLEQVSQLFTMSSILEFNPGQKTVSPATFLHFSILRCVWSGQVDMLVHQYWNDNLATFEEYHMVTEVISLQ